MKIKVRVIDRLSDRIATQRVNDRLRSEIERELQTVSASGLPIDPEIRRDALERAVRRLWGGTI
ncbi:MAG TPA: hypothetical protein VG900_13770 [Hyphomicrobiaceae bacterium]|nr:hypothetical protein [Hyphomicrobiaceae bacterium]